MKKQLSRTGLWDELLLDLAIVAAFQVLLIGLVRSFGFTAISDDDYARLVIAQQFAQAPSLDPSGTSWLPLPFWLTGTAMLIFGGSMLVGLGVQFVLSTIGATLLYVAGRNWGAGRRGALLGAVLCCLIPTASLLGAAAVPDFFTACLITVGVSLSRNPRSPIASGVCLGLASASRYEAWAPCLVLGALLTGDALRHAGTHRKLFSRTLGVLSCVAFPASWLLYGAFRHDDALFFAKRVVDYKAALGHDLPTWSEVLAGYPRLLLVVEPEITFCALFAGSAWLLRSRVPPAREAQQPAQFGSAQEAQPPTRLVHGMSGRSRPVLLLVALVLALLVGAIGGGAPTHHAERALLAVWLTAGLLLGRVLEAMTTWGKHAFGGWVSVLMASAVALLIRRESGFMTERFAERGAEEAIGHYIRQHAPDEEIALALPDYGYFAVMAAAENPRRFTVLQGHDPRQPPPAHDPLNTWLADGGAEPAAHCAYVTSRDRLDPGPRIVAIENEVMFARAVTCPKPP